MSLRPRAAREWHHHGLRAVPGHRPEPSEGDGVGGGQVIRTESFFRNNCNKRDVSFDHSSANNKRAFSERFLNGLEYQNMVVDIDGCSALFQ